MERFGHSYSVIEMPSESDEPAQTLIILGMTHGGGAAIAGLLRRLGVHLGNDVNDDTNEDQEIVASTQPLADLINTTSPKHTAAKQKLIDAITRKNRETAIWGWRDARAAQYLPVVFDELTNPRMIAVFCDHCEIASAEHREAGRDHLNTLVDIQRIFAATVDCLKTLNAPKMIVSYEQALRHPIEITTALAQFSRAPVVESDIPKIARFLERGAGYSRT